MPLGLKRHQREGDDHFITFSCYRREPYLTTASSKNTFLDSLELTRKRYNFEVLDCGCPTHAVSLHEWAIAQSAIRFSLATVLLGRGSSFQCRTLAWVKRDAPL
jgi:REP element-mobilizing transposase RayT